VRTGFSTEFGRAGQWPVAIGTEAGAHAGFAVMAWRWDEGWVSGWGIPFASWWCYPLYSVPIIFVGTANVFFFFYVYFLVAVQQQKDLLEVFMRRLVAEGCSATLHKKSLICIFKNSLLGSRQRNRSADLALCVVF